MSLLVEQITKPLLRRAGTAVAAYLAAKSVDAGAIDIIVDGLVMAGCVAVDLGFSYYNRRNVRGR